MENTNKIFQTPFFPFHSFTSHTIPLSSRTIEHERILTVGKKKSHKKKTARKEVNPHESGNKSIQTPRVDPKTQTLVLLARES
jgi:hypothetical protein